MSVRHIDFIKIKPSNILMVEVRPLRCSIATSSGMKKTAKWMSYEHWKELYLLLGDVTTLYQESKLMESTQEVRCYEHKMLYGNHIKIGYMFVAQKSCMCCYLIPRDDTTWTDDDDEGGKSPKDKDGTCEVSIPCGERLVVSVQLQNQQSFLQSDKQLSKALGSCFLVKNPLSDSIRSSQENYMESDFSSLLHSDEQENIKGMIGKSHSRVKQLTPKIHESNSDIDHDEIRSRKSIFDIPEEPNDHNAELVIRQLDEDVNNLFKDTIDGYPSQTEKCIYDNRISEEERLFVKEEMKRELVEDTEIPPSSSELQGICDNSQLLLGDCLFSLGRERSCDISKDEEKCIDYDTFEIVKTEEIEIFDNPTETELVSDHNSNVKYEVPPSYSPESRQVLLAYDVEEIGESPVDRTSVSHNEEPIIRTSLQHSERNTFKQDKSLTEKHCILSLEKNSSKSNVNPDIENKRSGLCEMVDYSMTYATQPSMITSNPESIKERCASDEDSCQKNYSNFMPNSSFPQSDNNDVGQPIVVSVPLECLHDTALSPIQKKAKLHGRKRRKKNKLQHLFGRGEGSNFEKLKPEEPFIKEDSELNSGEYVPTVKKSLLAKNITENMLSSYPEYTPSPIDRERATKQWKRKASSKQNYSEDPDYRSVHKIFGENDGEPSFRRSKRLQYRDTKGLYAYDILFFNEEMDEVDDQAIILNQDVKESEKREVKIVDQEKYVASLESSESVSIDHQKVIRGCKRPYKRKKTCSNLKFIKGGKDNQKHNFDSKNKCSHESAIGKAKRMSVIKSKMTVVEAKHSQETSDIKRKGKRKQGIVESEKTREGKIVLHEVMRDIEEARKRRLEDNPIPGYISGTQSLNDNSEIENVSNVVKKLIKPAKCRKVEKLSKLKNTNLSKKLIVTASMKKKCMHISNKNINSEKEVECKKIQKTAIRCKPLGREEFQEHRKNGNRSYTKISSIDFLGESSTADTCYNRKSKENKSQSMKLCGDLSFSNNDWGRENVDKIPVQDENTTLNISHPPLTSIDEEEFYLKTSPLIDHLKKCKTKLTSVPSSELSDRLEHAHEYLNGIINEKIYNEKHKIFKEHGKAWADMLNVEVYAVFREDQSEYMIDLMRKKYSRNLQFVIKNEYSRRQYIWKVLVPCFFIKLTMDILNIENEKEALDTLTQISMNFAD